MKYKVIDGKGMIPDGVTAIEDLVFAGCTNLQSIVIPDSVTMINHSAFTKCKSLSNIKIGKNTKFDIKTTFKGCPNAEKNGLYNSGQVF